MTAQAPKEAAHMGLHFVFSDLDLDALFFLCFAISVSPLSGPALNTVKTVVSARRRM